MPRPEDTARIETRKVLVMLRDSLDQPPLPAQPRLAVELVLDLLGEFDVAKRAASRDRLTAMLAELDGELAGEQPPLVTRPHDWPHDQ